MTRLQALSVGGLLGLSLVALGCGHTAFSPHFPDNRKADVGKALSPLRSVAPRPHNASGKPLALILTAETPSQVIGYDIAAGKALWKVAAAPTSRLVIGTSYFYHRSGKGQLVGRSLSSGAEVWRTSLQTGRLLGVAADGDTVYYATEVVRGTKGAEDASAFLVSVNGATGRKRWVRPSRGRLGAPAAAQGMVFVPLQSQSLAMLRGTDGAEVARIRSKDEAILWARTTDLGVYFGGKKGIYRLDKKAASGTQAGSTFIAAKLPKSVRPIYWWDGYNAALAGYTAYDRNRLLWQLNGDLSFAGDAIFVHNYRFFFAFKRGKDDSTTLRWAYRYPRHDVVASEFTGKSLLLVTRSGHLVALDPMSGLPIYERDLKSQVHGVSFDAAGYAAPGKAQGTPDLLKAITEMIWDPDRRFGDVKLFGVEELAKLEGAGVSEGLVRIVTQKGLDRAVYKRAGDMIVSRKDASAVALYLKTLQSHYSFVEGTESKAVDIMARALGALGAKEAVRPLLAHLNDHETPITAISDIVRALTAVGDKSILEPFRDFLLTYRSDPSFLKAPAGLNLIAEALLRMGGEDERQLLSFVENDSHTVRPLRVYLAAALRQSSKGNALAPKADK